MPNVKFYGSADGTIDVNGVPCAVTVSALTIDPGFLSDERLTALRDGGTPTPGDWRGLIDEAVRRLRYGFAVRDCPPPPPSAESDAAARDIAAALLDRRRAECPPPACPS